MKKLNYILSFYFIVSILVGCNSDKPIAVVDNSQNPTTTIIDTSIKNFKYLALGDSYYWSKCLYRMPIS